MSIMQTYCNIWVMNSRKKWPNLVKNKVLFHQGNAAVHTSVIAVSKTKINCYNNIEYHF